MQSELSTIARIQDPQEQEKQFLAFIKNHPELVWEKFDPDIVDFTNREYLFTDYVKSFNVVLILGGSLIFVIMFAYYLVISGTNLVLKKSTIKKLHDDVNNDVFAFKLYSILSTSPYLKETLYWTHYIPVIFFIERIAGKLNINHNVKSVILLVYALYLVPKFVLRITMLLENNYESLNWISVRWMRKARKNIINKKQMIKDEKDVKRIISLWYNLFEKKRTIADQLDKKNISLTKVNEEIRIHEETTQVEWRDMSYKLQWQPGLRMTLEKKETQIPIHIHITTKVSVDYGYIQAQFDEKAKDRNKEIYNQIAKIWSLKMESHIKNIQTLLYKFHVELRKRGYLWNVTIYIDWKSTATTIWFTKEACIALMEKLDEIQKQNKDVFEKYDLESDARFETKQKQEQHIQKIAKPNTNAFLFGYDEVTRVPNKNITNFGQKSLNTKNLTWKEW